MHVKVAGKQAQAENRQADGEILFLGCTKTQLGGFSISIRGFDFWVANDHPKCRPLACIWGGRLRVWDLLDAGITEEGMRIASVAECNKHVDRASRRPHPAARFNRYPPRGTKKDLML